jgi:UTP-glucose-1-phosphate uridylyltransferase
MHGIVVDSDHYDTGNPFGWLTTVIDIALKDPIVGKQLSEWLRSRGSG